MVVPVPIDDSAPLHEVVLEGLPLRLAERAREWFEALVREFDIIASESHVESPPQRLVELVADVRHRFSRFSAPSDTAMDRAAAEGRASYDVRLLLPEAAGGAATELLERIGEAVRFCEEGELLTLSAPDDVLRFATWYLTEVARQIEGATARPWRAMDSAPMDSAAGDHG